MTGTTFAPTPEQQKVVDHFDGHALVVAGPGSGKTVTLIAHVRKLIMERSVPPDSVWIMAFNRDISSKLRVTITEELKEKSPQVTTIHSYILSQTMKHGKQLLGDFEIADSLGNCGMERLLWKPIRKRLKEKHNITKTSQGKKLDVRHIKNHMWEQLRDYWLTSDRPNDNLFHKFDFEVRRLKAIYRIVFLDELALNFLDAIKANPSFRQDVAKPRIVIDEFQDLNPTEHGILQQFDKEGTAFVVFGDDDQAVMDFRRAHADHIHDFVQTYSPTQYPLARDRRCPKEILALADEFVKGLPCCFDKPAGCAPHQGRVDILNFEIDQQEVAGMGNIVTRYLSLFPEHDGGKNPQVLVLSGATGKARGRSRIAEIIEVLRNAEIDQVTGERKEDPLDSEWGLAFKSLLTILAGGFSPMSVAAWLSVTSPGLMTKVDEYLEDEDRKGNQVDFLQAVLDISTTSQDMARALAEIENLKLRVQDDKFDPEVVTSFIPDSLHGRTEAQSLIQETWSEFQEADAAAHSDFPETDSNESSKGQRFLQSLSRRVTEDIKRPEVGRVHVTTYRKAKGLEADLVIVTSVDSRDFRDHAQNRRLLYVAATRCKKNLVLTFANKRSGARRYTAGTPKGFEGVPKVYRSPLIPSRYPPREYSEQWLTSWEPV